LERLHQFFKNFLFLLSFGPFHWTLGSCLVFGGGVVAGFVVRDDFLPLDGGLGFFRRGVEWTDAGDPVVVLVPGLVVSGLDGGNNGGFGYFAENF